MKTATDVRPIVAYYEGATPDYEAWSAHFNMHFGYWRPWLNPFDREAMLEQMNREVIFRLSLAPGSGRILDMGCGVGGTLRHGARLHPDKQWVGISLVQAQLDKASELNGSLPIKLECCDYTATQFDSGSFDGVYALESACHSQGPGKPGVIHEAYRLLRPGAKFSLADGFLTCAPERLGWPFGRIHDLLCANWAVPGFAQLEPFVQTMREAGFQDIQVQDIRFRIGPSALHAPLLVLVFCLQKILRGQALSAISRRHLWACLLSPVLGMHPGFSYFIIHARKP